jgi:hypothetical protein
MLTSLYSPFSTIVTPVTSIEINKPATTLLNPVYQPYLQNVVLLSSEEDNKTKLFTIPLVNKINLNDDPNIVNIVVDGIYNYMFNTWINENLFTDIFKYMKMVDGKVRLISKNQFSDTRSDKDKNKKKEFLKNNILSWNRVQKIIADFLKNSETTWVDVDNNQIYIKKLIHKYLHKKLRMLTSSTK